MTESLNKLLLQAAKNGDLDRIKQILAEGANINAIDSSSGAGVISCSVRYGRFECFEYLLNNGADIHQPEDIGTLVHIVALTGDAKSMRLLIEQGIDIHAKNKEAGNTALHMATQSDAFACAMTLIEHGADLYVKNNRGETPLADASDQMKAFIRSILETRDLNDCIRPADCHGNDLGF